MHPGASIWLETKVDAVEEAAHVQEGQIAESPDLTFVDELTMFFGHVGLKLEGF